jgi:glucose/mannose-6-phosphate isomerase
VLAAVDLADNRGTKVLVITTGGKLAAYAERSGTPLWKYESNAPARAAFGWMIGLLLALVNRLKLVREMSADVTETLEVLERNVHIMSAESVVVKNPAKRLAGQMIGRTPIIYGAGITAPVARRWKTQLNQNGKTLAAWEEIPELNHNAMAGMNYPSPLMTKIAMVFLAAEKSDDERVTARWNLTRTLYLEEGIASDTVKARGVSKLAQVMSTIHYGDYVSYYVAMAYGVDPSATMMISDLNDKLSSKPSSQQ